MDENVELKEDYLEGLYNERDAILEKLRTTDPITDAKEYSIMLTVIDRISKQIQAEEDRIHKNDDILNRAERERILDERHAEEMQMKQNEIDNRAERERILDERYEEEQRYKKRRDKMDTIQKWAVGIGLPVFSGACYMIFGLAQRGWEESGGIFTTKVQNIFKPKM